MLSNILIYLLLIAFNGFMVISEMALLDIRRNRHRINLSDDDKTSNMLDNMISDQRSFFAIQAGSSMAWLLLGVFVIFRFREMSFEYLSKSTPDSSGGTLYITLTVVTIIVMTYISMLLGVILPKIIGARSTEKTARRLCYPLYFYLSLVKPLSFILKISSDGLVKIFNIDSRIVTDVMTEEEILHMVDAGAEKGAIDEDEVEMINNIFEFDDKNCSDIATHRTEIIALPVDADYQSISDIILDKMYSRIPVYEDTLDNIVGILHVKDLTSYILSGTLKNMDIKKIMRKPYFVPFSKKTDTLFKEMQKRKEHMAVVVDEYGGTMGIVTMEDIVEEVMGDILDEYDDEDPDFDSIDENTYIVSGSAGLEDVSELFEIELPVDEYDTLSGFIISQLGRIPDEGEQPELEFGGLLFKVYKVEEKRIDSAVICKL